MEFQKYLISLYYPQFLPHLYSNKDSEYHKTYWGIMREKHLKKRYDKYKDEHGGESPLPEAIDLVAPIDVDALPNYPKKRTIKHKEITTLDNIIKSINIRDHVVIHNKTGKGLIYAILSEKRRTLKNLMKRSERNKEDDEDEDEDYEDTQSCKQYKVKRDFESVLHNEVQKAIKRKSERDDPSEASEEDEGEDTEEIIKEHQLKNRRFIRNTDDDSETEESEPSVILIAFSPSPTTPAPPAAPAPPATPKLKRRKVIHDDN
jgi:hypothetical protein